MTNANFIIGIDVGATNLKMGFVDSSGNIFERLSTPVKGKKSATDLIELIKDSVDELMERCGKTPAAIGCGIPGIVDVETGVVHKSPNYPQWQNIAMRYELFKATGFPVVMDNDANMFALGEHRFGAGKGSRNMILLTLGTGIGGGLILNDELFHGDIGYAGEVGHVTVEIGGERCGCGKRGCWERYAASHAFPFFAKSLSSGERNSLFAAAGVKSLGELTPDLMSQVALGGNEIARKMWNTFGAYLGIGIGDLINTLGVTTFVIGGGISKSWDLFIESTRREIANHTYQENAERLILKRAELGDDAGILGSATEALLLI